MPYEYEELRALIPLYLNGRCSEKEKKAFEEALDQFPKLRQELTEFSEIKEIYNEIGREMPIAAENLYGRILERARREQRILLPVTWKGYKVRISELLKALFWSPRLSWAIVAAQLVIIFLLVFSLSEGDRFKTLTPKEPSREGWVRINILFDEGSSEREIRKVLHQAGALIIHGPSPEGLYIIEVRNGREVEGVLKTLRTAKIVRFAEKVP